MTWYEDLSPCGYFGENCAIHLKAIGWLGEGKPYRTGDIPDVARRKLWALVEEHIQPTHALGAHHCELCPDHKAAGHRNLFVPAGDFLYVCPELILHYIEVHHYRPPNEFFNAVMRCPRTWTLAYEWRFRRSFGPGARDESPCDVAGGDFLINRLWIVRLLGSVLP